MKPITIDSETNILNQGEGSVGKDKASPFHPMNDVVSFGALGGGAYQGVYYPDHHGVRGEAAWYALPTMLDEWPIGTPILLVGQNISFDIKYIMKQWPKWWADHERYVYIWDTQQVEYLLSCQANQYASLDSLCNKYDLPLKDDKIKEYWEKNLDTSLIPVEELMPYMKTDVVNTRAVFDKQYEEIRDNPDLFNLIRVKMDDILCTTIMEWNGMHFDIELAHAATVELEKSADFYRKAVHTMVEPFWNKEVDFNPQSPEHISAAMFGGTLRVKKAVEIVDDDGNLVYYKTGKKAGQVKTKQQDVEVVITGMKIPTEGVEKVKKAGVYSTANETLSKFTAYPFVNDLLELRAIEKEISTYFKGYTELVWLETGLIHPSINHCSTVTGRQSCTKPNLQNVVRSEE